VTLMAERLVDVRFVCLASAVPEPAIELLAHGRSDRSHPNQGAAPVRLDVCWSLSNPSSVERRIGSAGIALVAFALRFVA
jgi:hypothetical protein